MNKQEAIEAMTKGAKLTHRSFTPEEWVTICRGYIKLEDGVTSTPREFWRWRDGKEWDNDWSIWN